MSYPNLAALARNLRTTLLTRDEFSQIAQTTLTGSAASVTLSSIPDHFRSLLFFVQLRTDRSAERDQVYVRLNADSGNNYDSSRSYFRAGATVTSVSRGSSSMRLMFCEAANARGNNFSPGYLFAPGYSKADREKWMCSTISASFGDVSADADLYTQFAVGRWRNTSAVTSVTFFPAVGPNLVAGCIFQLYGLA